MKRSDIQLKFLPTAICACLVLHNSFVDPELGKILTEKHEQDLLTNANKDKVFSGNPDEV